MSIMASSVAEKQFRLAQLVLAEVNELSIKALLGGESTAGTEDKTYLQGKAAISVECLH